MKIYQKLFISGFFALAFLVSFGSAKAATLSQTTVSVAIGQTSTIYASSVITSLSITNNSNPSVASVSVLGNDINIYGITTGSTVATICDDVSICNAVYITVGGGSSGALSLNQTSISLSTGQSSVIYASNASGSLYLSTNSNPNVASATVSGSSINIYAVTSGSTTVTVCESGLNVCGSVYVTVNGNGSYGSLSLSQTSLSLSIGQTSTITAYNTYGTSTTLYVSSNSNPNVATATVIGSVVSVYGSSTGSSTLTICQNYNSSCGTVYVTVNGYGYNNGTNTLGLNISNLTLTTGGSATVSSSNSNYYSGQGLYVSSNSNPSIVSTSTGSSSVTSGCYAGALYSITTGQPCANIYNNSTNTNYYIPGCYAGAIYSITTGQLCSNLNGVTNNNGSITISAIAPGSDTLTLCQSGGVSACSTMYVTVTGYAVPLSYSPTTYSPTTYNNSGIPTVYSTSNAN